jgi:hypothetical protein
MQAWKQRNPERAREINTEMNRKRRATDPRGVNSYHAEWRARNAAQWRATVKQANQRLRDNLGRKFVLDCLVQRGSDVKRAEIPEELIELKREQLRLHRLAKQLEQAIKEKS